MIEEHAGEKRSIDKTVRQKRKIVWMGWLHSFSLRNNISKALPQIGETLEWERCIS